MAPSATERRRQLTAARKRRWRRRWKLGRACYVIEVDSVIATEMLIAGGYLAVRDLDNRQAVGAALTRWLVDYFEGGG
jgi:hypothetical protein